MADVELIQAALIPTAGDRSFAHRTGRAISCEFIIVPTSVNRRILYYSLFQTDLHHIRGFIQFDTVLPHIVRLHVSLDVDFSQ